MEIQKSIIALTFILFALTGIMAANDHNPFMAKKCKSIAQLNNTMNAKLELTDNQLIAVFDLNESYWHSRKNIKNTPERIGQNTALLACWDKWRLSLAENLTKLQMEKFMQWQSQVDLLGNTPY